MVVGRVALYLLVHDHMGSSLIIGLVKGKTIYMYMDMGSQRVTRKCFSGLCKNTPQLRFCEPIRRIML